MSDEPITADQISAVTSFSVGVLEGRDAMMVIEYARTPEELLSGVRQRHLLALTPQQARELAEGLMMAAQSAGMGAAPTRSRN
jgi:hypothetical protein